MAEKIIMLNDERGSSLAIPPVLETPTGSVRDALARPLHDLRISVTDRCNFRCVYCMPKEVFDKDYAYLPHSSLLSFEEITRVARLFVEHGVEKIRLTGGEPLLRKNLENLIAMLAALRTPSGRALDITLTTNGSLLAKKAQSLKDAGLNRVTVSLDALDDATFKRMNDVDFAVADVLEGIDAAHRVGLGPIKINMVVKGGMNDQEIVPMARHFKGSPYILRFIEYMDVGASNGWNLDEVIPSAQVVRRISAEMPLEPRRSDSLGRGGAPHRRRDAARADRRQLRRRDRRALALCRRRRRDRPDLQRHASLLQGLLAHPPVDRGQAVHLPVRHPRPRPARPAARRPQRRRDLERGGAAVAQARRPLFRNAHHQHRRHRTRREKSRNVLHRRLITCRKKNRSAG
jgi:cyclic pyranopterin phosphate synthase